EGMPRIAHLSQYTDRPTFWRHQLQKRSQTMRSLAAALLAACVSACSSARSAAPPPASPPPPARAPARDTTPVVQAAAPEPVAYPSTYKPLPSRTTVIRNATILTGVGATIQSGSVLLRDGKVAEVGSNISVPADAVVVDAA